MAEKAIREEYTAPDFLKDSDVDTIHGRMLDTIPDEIEKARGGYVWDMTRPTAMEHARIKGYAMNEAIKQIFPMFASGDFLDYHGTVRNLQRKAGIAATGELTITGDAGTVINDGDLFSTESKNGVASIMYFALGQYTIPESGSIIIKIQCNEVGVVGNATVNTIILKHTPNDGIKTVTNEAVVTGGIDSENDDDYRERILEYDRNSDVSYVGSVTDFRRWANQVDGVGTANVIAAKDDTGTVTIVLSDGNGDPATQELCTAVYNYIMSPDDPWKRLTSPNVILKVIPAVMTDISVSATIALEESTIEHVKASALAALKEYLIEAVSDGEVQYMEVCAILKNIQGVYDISNVKINNGTANIPITQDQNPRITEDSLQLAEKPE